MNRIRTPSTATSERACTATSTGNDTASSRHGSASSSTVQKPSSPTSAVEKPSATHHYLRRPAAPQRWHHRHHRHLQEGFSIHFDSIVGITVQHPTLSGERIVPQIPKKTQAFPISNQIFAILFQEQENGEAVLEGDQSHSKVIDTVGRIGDNRHRQTQTGTPFRVTLQGSHP